MCVSKDQTLSILEPIWYNLSWNAIKTRKNSLMTFLQTITKRWRWCIVPIGIVIVALGLLAVPILLDLAPPNLEINGIETGKTYRGRVTLNISVTDTGSGLASLSLMLDDSPQPLALNEIEAGRTSRAIDTTPLADGSHVVSIVAADKSIFRNKSQQSFEFLVDNTSPQINVPPESLRVGQGKTLPLFIQIDEPAAQVEGKLFGWNFTCYPVVSDTYFRGLIGISVTHPAKTYPLALRVVDLVGNTVEEVFRLKVKRTMFQRGGYITLSPAKRRTMMNKAKSQSDNVKRGKAYTQSTKVDTQLWNGKFVKPAKGRLTSSFGKYREYNTGVRRHHLGIDIANSLGTPIYAGNSGIVTLAGRLHLYGKSVVINHGQGVSSSYNHLSKIHVAAEEQVEKGQLIGLMGATGQVTGSHLHWGMVVNGIAVDPEEWTERDFSLP